jgi:hypothetical protein
MHILSPEKAYFGVLALLEHLPERPKTAASTAQYQSHFVRMWREPVLDPRPKMMREIRMGCVAPRCSGASVLCSSGL